MALQLSNFVYGMEYYSQKGKKRNNLIWLTDWYNVLVDIPSLITGSLSPAQLEDSAESCVAASVCCPTSCESTFCISDVWLSMITGVIWVSCLSGMNCNSSKITQLVDPDRKCNNDAGNFRSFPIEIQLLYDEVGLGKFYRNYWYFDVRV